MIIIGPNGKTNGTPKSEWTVVVVFVAAAADRDASVDADWIARTKQKKKCSNFIYTVHKWGIEWFFCRIYCCHLLMRIKYILAFSWERIFFFRFTIHYWVCVSLFFFVYVIESYLNYDVFIKKKISWNSRLSRIYTM